jgi:nitroreductase
MNETIEILKSHTSTRKYSDELISDEVVKEIVYAGFSASTSSNIQAATVVRVREPETREAIAALAGNQTYVVSSAVFLVWCADLYRSSVACKLGGGTFEAGMTEHLIIATVDAALAAQNAAIAAESLGLGICYIGGIRNDPEKMAELLNLPNQVFPVFGMCIGRPAESVEKKPRLPLNVTLIEERYSGCWDEESLQAYDLEMQSYYARRGALGRSWIADMSKLLGKEARPHMRAFLESHGFGTR